MTASFLEFMELILSTRTSRTSIDELGHGYRLPQHEEYDETFEFVYSLRSQFEPFLSGLPVGEIHHRITGGDLLKQDHRWRFFETGVYH